MKEEILFLKKEVDLLKKNLKSSQTLDDIMLKLATRGKLHVGHLINGR